jgi:type III secretion protein T
MPQTLFDLMMGFPRVATFLLVLPLFGPKTFRGVALNVFVLSQIIFLLPLLESAASASAPHFSEIDRVMIVVKEVFVGGLLGFSLATVFLVAQSVGYLIDLQTGSNNSATFDPTTNHEEGPMSGFLLQFVIALFLAGGGLLHMLGLLFESYAVWPIESWFPKIDVSLRDYVSAQSTSILQLIVKLAVPVVMILLLVEIGLGLMNRFAPQLDVFHLAMPIKGCLATLILIVFLGFMYDSIHHLLFSGNAAFDLLRGVLSERR